MEAAGEKEMKLLKEKYYKMLEDFSLMKWNLISCLSLPGIKGLSPLWRIEEKVGGKMSKAVEVLKLFLLFAFGKCKESQ